MQKFLPQLPLKSVFFPCAQQNDRLDLLLKNPLSFLKKHALLASSAKLSQNDFGQLNLTAWSNEIVIIFPSIMLHLPKIAPYLLLKINFKIRLNLLFLPLSCYA